MDETLLATLSEAEKVANYGRRVWAQGSHNHTYSCLVESQGDGESSGAPGWWSQGSCCPHVRKLPGPPQAMLAVSSWSYLPRSLWCFLPVAKYKDLVLLFIAWKMAFLSLPSCIYCYSWWCSTGHWGSIFFFILFSFYSTHLIISIDLSSSLLIFCFQFKSLFKPL